jgi:hypothetical protein
MFLNILHFVFNVRTITGLCVGLIIGLIIGFIFGVSYLMTAWSIREESKSRDGK